MKKSQTLPPRHAAGRLAKTPICAITAPKNRDTPDA